MNNKKLQKKQDAPRVSNRKPKQLTVTLVGVFLMLLVLIGFEGKVRAAHELVEVPVPIFHNPDPQSDYQWYGYEAYTGGYPKYDLFKTYYHDLRVNLHGSKSYQVYCFNVHKHYPRSSQSFDRKWYKKLDGTAENFDSLAMEPRVRKEELTKKLRAVMYNAYPNDANGIMKDLEPLNAIKVTQEAVWYYSDNSPINPDESFKSEALANKISATQISLMREALKQLIAPDLDEKQSRRVPDGYQLSIFESENKDYQNLLAAEEVPIQPPKPGDKPPLPPVQTKKTSVIIRKYAEGDYSKLLEGATLKLSQIEGSGFQEKIFDSNKSGEKVELPNGTYVLSELKPPQGYGVATPITFKVAAGKVLIKNKEGQFVENQNKEVAEPYSVTAYNDFDDSGFINPKTFTPYGKFYYAKNANGTSQVVYCFNADLHSPPDSLDKGETIDPDFNEGKEIKYTHILGADLSSYANNPRASTNDELLSQVKKVLEKGYRDDSTTYANLTSVEFRAATQLAIYYFTDSADLDNLADYHGFGALTTEALNATKEIVAYAEDRANLPNISNLDFYVPNSNKYQSLIGTQYHPESLVDIIRMEDKQAPIIPITHKLTISKTVTGTIADKKKEFNFEIHLKSSDGQAISGTYPTNSGELTVTDGKATFTLKDGESLIVEGLPSGYSYEITETGASDYEVSVNGQNVPDGKVMKELVKEDETVAFENRKDLVPPTGFTTDGGTYLWLLLLVPFGLLVWFFGRKGLKND
ncbi:TPA: pilus ancillary protein 1 [Streptococcus pyogenes]|uniref:pilus ancillary protein 1 n=1 Tax=Streptococcus pyogenes TaxID=1314 RepID=UPI00109D228A|nr:pilus ancillary protein 1 [Streptococcus pyogenes]VGV41372.1 fimbrial minor sturctural protein Cpa/FctA [Streptococcus pyogenes]VHA64004.1 fimbrial minor sturctural protein Cpa/FctA [Streptococcus pyogenes]VHA79214.1 fimbrial minor sturctural protein Cpa/FctA [Streptococcus pyogenes]VHD17810.1 fimbrial minor sturctural protein Cpa/FctA [Streptococcus pyogenes]HER5543167.1 pilus ancillary protein 1 [Streptococcus pyogenes]